MNTYQSFYQNEVRALEITINDQDGNDFAPSAAWTQVENAETGLVVIQEQPAMVYNNKIRTLVGTVVTSSTGEYKIIWRIGYAGYSYYHVTILEVQEL